MIPLEHFTSRERRILADVAKMLPDRIHGTFRKVPGVSHSIISAGGGYLGIWQEHNQDCFLLAELFPEEAWASMKIFMDFQMRNGLMPAAVRFEPTSVIYGQLQIVWPFARCAFEIVKRTKGSDDDLRQVYACAARYDRWLMSCRDHSGTGLVEMFCEYDTGHDNSPRVLSGGIDHKCPGLYAGNMPDLSCMPLVAADLSATRYQSLIALAEMAERLQLTEEAVFWGDEAKRLKAKMMELLYDPEDEYFYDRAPSGFRKFRSEHITRFFLNHVVDQNLFDRIYHRYFENENEFLTPWAFPSMSVSDPAWIKEPLPNCWGRNTQALTQLRALLWMDYYHREKDLEGLMSRMLRNYIEFPQNNFTQEIDPFTGITTHPQSHDYLPAMIFFLFACRRLEIA